MPYQVANEFLKLREDIIEKEGQSFQDVLEFLKKWKDSQINFDELKGLINRSGGIVRSEVSSLFDCQDRYKTAVEEVEECFRHKIEELGKTHSLQNSEDFISEKILELFDGKVGESYSSTDLQNIYQEGEERYEQKKPPGFRDEKRKADERKYGDFILWKQILDFAKERSRSIVFVTGEKKEDWWIKKKGKIVSPHFELRREFQEEVDRFFWMYSTLDFLEIAKEKLSVPIHPKSIEEANIVAETEANSADEQYYEGTDLTPQQIQNFIRISDKVREAQKQVENFIINDEIRKALEQIQNPIRISDEIRKALEQIQNPIRISDEIRKALQQIQYPTINDEIRKALKQIEKFNNRGF